MASLDEAMRRSKNMMVRALTEDRWVSLGHLLMCQLDTRKPRQHGYRLDVIEDAMRRLRCSTPFLYLRLTNQTRHVTMRVKDRREKGYETHGYHRIHPHRKS